MGGYKTKAVRLTSDTAEVKVSVKYPVSEGSVLWKLSSKYTVQLVTYHLVLFVDPWKH